MIALRCEGCGASLTVRGEARYVSCASCGAGLEVIREGGAVYTAIDRGLSAASPPADAASREVSARRAPARGASIAGGAVAAGAGIGWSALSLSSGSWGWLAAGALVTLMGLASAIRSFGFDRTKSAPRSPEGRGI